MSGKAWIGTTSVPKPQSGQLIVESISVASSLADAETVRCFTTADGLGRWLGTVTRFDGRRGGTLKFESGFAGSYSVLNVPSQVVLATDVHGQIEINMQPNSTPMRVDVTITRFVLDSEDLPSVRAIVQCTLQAVEERLRG